MSVGTVTVYLLLGLVSGQLTTSKTSQVIARQLSARILLRACASWRNAHRAATSRFESVLQAQAGLLSWSSS